MRTLMNLTPKKVGELAPGELLRMDFGTASGLALLLNPNLEGDPIVGVISSPDFQTPLCWWEASNTDRCLSYGHDWYLEERPGPETAPGGQLPGGRTAVAFYDTDGLVLRFAPPRGFAHQGILFNLHKGELSRQLSSKAAPLDGWAIWANVDHYRYSQQPALFEWPIPAAT